MLKDYDDDSRSTLDKIFAIIHEPLDILTDIAWLLLVVDGRNFAKTSEHFAISGLAWLIVCVSAIRMANARRSRNLIWESGLQNSRGYRLREVVYAAQQIMFEDVPMFVLVGYVSARLIVMGTSLNGVWVGTSLLTLLASEISFVKFGRALSRAGFSPAKDHVAPVLLLAFNPPGLKARPDSQREDGPGHRGEPLWGAVSHFDDKGDESINDINTVLGSQWL